MRINRALGLGIAILVLQWLMGNVFAAFEHTAVQAFNFAQAALSAAERGIDQLPDEVGAIGLPHPLPSTPRQ